LIETQCVAGKDSIPQDMIWRVKGGVGPDLEMGAALHMHFSLLKKSGDFAGEREREPENTISGAETFYGQGGRRG
jgi:hypothetical protein